MPRLKRVARKCLVGDGVVETVRTLYQSGQSISAISEEVGLTQVQITKIIKENGLQAECSSSKKDHPKLDIAMSVAEESTVLKFLLFLEPLCWDWKFRTLKQIVNLFASNAGIHHQLSPNWRREFAAKHKDDLSDRLRAAFQLAPSKLPVSPIQKLEFFSVVADLFSRLQIETKPDHIWAFGSADVLLPEPPKRSTWKKNEKSKEEHVSALYAISASGDHTPGTLLFKGARIATEWKALLKPENQDHVHLLVNDTGFADHSSSVKWLKNFLRWTEVRPVVLFCDPLYCHAENFGFMKLAYESNIHLVTVPKKLMSSIKLPFSNSVMGHLKDKWYEELDEMQLSVTPTSPLTRSQVVQAFAPTHLSMNEDLIKESFQKCGIYPLDPNAQPREPVKALYEPEQSEEVIEMPPLSPDSQEAVNIALEAYARAGVSESKAMKLLRNMNVPGFALQ